MCTVVFINSAMKFSTQFPVRNFEPAWRRLKIEHNCVNSKYYWLFTRYSNTKTSGFFFTAGRKLLQQAWNYKKTSFETSSKISQSFWPIRGWNLFFFEICSDSVSCLRFFLLSTFRVEVASGVISITSVCASRSICSRASKSS